jgi:hypothetical protein
MAELPIPFSSPKVLIRTHASSIVFSTIAEYQPFSLALELADIGFFMSFKV